jgi:hypothetical protein
MNEHQPLRQSNPEELALPEAFAAYALLHDDSGPEAAADPELLAQFKDAFFGQYDAPEDWATELLSAGLEAKLTSAVPDTLRAYVRIDYAGLAHDAAQNGEIHIEPAPDGKVWVFLRP